MTILLCDVGGTHIRFASAKSDGAMCVPEKLRVDLHSSLQDAIARYLSAQALPADSVTHLYLAFSNRNDWSTEKAMLQTVLPKAVITQVNDFEANALGILSADPSDFQELSKASGDPVAHASRVVLGVGTGLGLAYALQDGERQFIQRTHGGHMLPAAGTPEHQRIITELAAAKADNTVAIYEDVLSGAGLFALYRLVCHRNQLNPEYHDVSDIILSGREDPVVRQTLEFWHEILGVFAHQAVAFGYSYGGVYLTGGMIDRLIGSGLFDMQSFLRCFRQKNVPIVVRDVMSTPVYWVKDEFVSLRGLLRHACDQKED